MNPEFRKHDLDECPPLLHCRPIDQAAQIVQQTRRFVQIKRGLLPPEEAGAAVAELRRALLAPADKIEVALASSFWAADDFSLRPQFVARAKALFDAAVATVDFGDPAAIAQINDWVSGHTRDKIPLMENEAASARLVERGEAFGFEMASLPYGDGAFSMIIVLPVRRFRPALLDHLTADAWTDWMGRLEPGPTLKLWLPIFNANQQHDLKPILTELGMGIFSMLRPLISAH